MKKSSKYGWVTLLAAMISIPSFAQIIEPPQPQFLHRVIASPRLSAANLPLTDRPISIEEDQRNCRTIGAVYNFAKRDGHVVVRKGTAVRFLIDTIEGVWYERACAWLGVYVEIDVHDQGTDRWENVGSYVRHARTCGPRKGTAADAGIAFLRGIPGDYLVRARIQTFAFPLRSDLEFSHALYPCADVAIDEVFTKVRVVEATPSPEDLDWAAEKPIDGVEDDRVFELEELKM